MDFLTTSQFSRPRLLLILLLALKINADVSCQAGVFSLGFPGNVICDFGTIDIKREKHNFNVVQYSYLGSGDSGNYVLLCNWIPNSESLECTVKDGYTFNRQVNTGLTLNIPDVTESMGGMYVCQLVPDNGVPVSTCNLTVIAATTPSSAPLMDEIATKGPEAKEDGGYGIAIAVMGCVIFALGLSLALTIICLRKRYRLISRAAGPGRDDWGNILICCQPCQMKQSQSTAGEEAYLLIHVLGPNDKCVSTDDDHMKEVDEMKKAVNNMKIAKLRAEDESTQGEAENSPESSDTIEGSNPQKATTASDDSDGLNEITRSGESKDAFNM